MLNGSDGDRFGLVDQVEYLSGKISDENLKQWATKQHAQIFQSLGQPDPSSVPYLLKVIEQRGVPFLKDTSVILFPAVSQY